MSIVEASGIKGIAEVSHQRGMFSYAGTPISPDFLEHLKPKHARKRVDDDDEVSPSASFASLPASTAASGFHERQSTPSMMKKKTFFYHPLGLKTDEAKKRTCFEGHNKRGDDFQSGVNAKIKMAELRMHELLEQRLQEQREQRILEEQARKHSNSQGMFASLPAPPEDHPWPGPSSPGRTHISSYQGTILHRSSPALYPTPPPSAKSWASRPSLDAHGPASLRSIPSTPALSSFG